MRVFKFSVSITLLLFAATFAHADAPPETTGGYVNGRLWKRWPASTKLAFLVGIGDASALCDTNSKENLYLFNSTMTHVEIMKAIDDMYVDATNSPLPVIGVYRYVARKAGGASAHDLEVELSKLRTTAARLLENTPPKPPPN